MTDDFLSYILAQGLTISQLTLLPTQNAQNATQQYQARLQPHLTQQPDLARKLPAQTVFIKRLVLPCLAYNLQQFNQEIIALQACQRLAVEASNSKKPAYGVAKLLASYHDTSCAFMVLPFYQGNTLKALLHQAVLTFEQKINYAISLCQVLKKIHCLGYLHGDIKPSNLFITSSNQLILLDFGLSQSIGEVNPTSNKTTAGTPAYMSPEQFNGFPLTAHSDYYSLGIVLFELFFGKLPFIATTLHDWAVAHCQQPLPICSTLPTIRYLTNTQQIILESVMLKLLAKDPKKRSRDLQDIITLLSALGF